MYRDLVESRIRELDGTAGFALTRIEIAGPAPRGVLDTALRSAGGRLPAGAAEFYGELNGFTLQWTYTPPGDADGIGGIGDEGSINLLPVERSRTRSTSTTSANRSPGSRSRSPTTSPRR
ncbi:hypothetical protein PUR71_11105 [Streptomyces sp. SP17BM10]|uniref:hypothetical protein n=1 Tax=Streptomyces sp. SP17BM10 TaxID=3002530 RepID=UPI002E7A6DEA|nr:hypothetical protein [Streptomyces sp. SP17BM10]MEE1783453.1 hypothetical protein [Streptomyces sp. SP17BM10]